MANESMKSCLTSEIQIKITMKYSHTSILMALRKKKRIVLNADKDEAWLECSFMHSCWEREMAQLLRKGV